MQLSEVEALLGIKITEAQKPTYEIRLEAAIDQACGYCKQDFMVDGVQKLPASVKMGVAMMVQGMGEKQNVQSQSLGDMSKSFFKNGTFDAAMKYLDPYVLKKVGFV